MLPPDWLTHPRRITGERLVTCSKVASLAGHATAAAAFARLAQLEGPAGWVLGLAWLAGLVGARALRRWGHERSTAEFYDAQRRPLRLGRTRRGPELSGF